MEHCFAARKYVTGVQRFVSLHLHSHGQEHAFPGGGYLVYLSDGDVPSFRVSFSPIISGTGYRKNANFLEQVVKT